MLDNFDTRPSRFVFDEADELRPTSIGYGLGKVMVLDHALDVQGFQPDQAKLIDNRSAEFVMKVFSAVCDLLMGSRHNQSGFVPAVTALDLAAYPSLSNLDQVFSLAQVLWWFDLGCLVLTTENSKVFQPQVDTDRLLIRGGLNVLFDLALDGDKIMSGLS